MRFGKEICLIISSTFLLTVTQAPYQVTFLRWVALIPFLLVFVDPSFTPKKKIFLAWLLGFLFLLFQYVIFWDLLPLDWIGITNSFVGILVTFFLWVIFSLTLSLPFLLFYIARFSIYSFPLLWVLQEYVRSWFYSLVTLGDASVLGDHFSYGFLGYSAHTSPLLLTLAPYIGVYGLSFVITVINVCLLFLARKIFVRREYVWYGILVGLIIFFCFIEIFSFREDPPGVTDRVINVVALQGNNPFLFGYTEEYYLKIAHQYKDAIHEAISKYPETDLVIVPESSLLIETLAREAKKDLKGITEELLGKDRYRMIIYGNYDEENNRSVISIISNDRGEPAYSQNKALLMPLGEYQPYIIQYGARFFGKRAWLNTLQSYREVNAIDDEDRVIETPLGSIAGVECSEILSFDIYRKIHEQKADFIVHLQRLAAFHDSERIFRHILSVSKLRAATYRKYIVGSVDHSGRSYIINPRGKIQLIGDTNDKYIVSAIVL